MFLIESCLVVAGVVIAFTFPTVGSYWFEVCERAFAKLRIYAGASGDFTLYRDDGKTYGYEKGDSSITHLHWDDAAQKLSHEGAQAWTGSDAQIIEIVGH